MKVGQSFKHKEKTSESMELKAKKGVSKGLRDALVDENDGLFRPGALPKMSGLSSGGNKKLLESVAKVGHGEGLEVSSGPVYKDIGDIGYFQRL